jgi:hypothetical protein
MIELFEEQDAKPMIEKTTEVSISQKPDDRLLEQVLSSGNIEVLERYISLRKSEEERQARIAFDEAFSRMRAELPSVAKHRDNGATKSKYAPVEDIQRMIDPIVHKHGFSYSWREEAITEGKRVWMDISGYGHVRSNFFDCPKIAGNNAQNAIQVAGAMSTYGRRYTMISGFGVIVEGEDSDGQIPDDLEVLKMDLQSMLEEKDQSGKFKLPQTAHDLIKKELSNPSPDVARLKAFYQRAKKITGK